MHQLPLLAPKNVSHHLKETFPSETFSLVAKKTSLSVAFFLSPKALPACQKALSSKNILTAAPPQQNPLTAANITSLSLLCPPPLITEDVPQENGLQIPLSRCHLHIAPQDHYRWFSHGLSGVDTWLVQDLPRGKIKLQGRMTQMEVYTYV